jgi:hypothetical protein
MRKSTFALAASLLIAIFWLGSAKTPRAAEDTGQDLKIFPKWQYHVEELNYSDRGTATDTLNKLGSDGWDLSVVMPEPNSTWRTLAILKRQR